MIKKLSVLLIILFSAHAHGQEALNTHRNEVDALGRQQGEWKVFDEKGNLKYEGRFNDGYPVGEFLYYYPTGSVKARTNNLQKGTIVYAETYYDNGLLMASGKYVNQKKDSVWQYFSADEGGYLSAEESYENTIPEGTWRTFFPSGQVAEEITYVNGQKEGKWVQYFTDGQLRAEGTFRQDQLQGLFRAFYPSGKVNISGTYKNSLKDGTWMYFTEIEEAEMKEVYRKGVLVSKEVFIEPQ